MADFTKLNDAISKLDTDLATYQAAVQTAITNATSTDQAAVDSATTAVEASDKIVTDATAGLTPPTT